MNSTELIILNFKEVRRRSEKIWTTIPTSILDWKPDENAMSILEMIRHVLEGEHIYHQLVIGRGTLDNFNSPWSDLPYTSISNELKFAEKYRKQFLETVSRFTVEELETITIDRASVNQYRKLGDYLLRIAYHEAVHAGQMLGYLRTKGAKRANIWD